MNKKTKRILKIILCVFILLLTAGSLVLLFFAGKVENELLIYCGSFVISCYTAGGFVDFVRRFKRVCKNEK